MNDTFWFGELTFDFTTRRLLCNGEQRHLSPKAQQMLHMLLVARPRVLTKQELYDTLWPSTFVCETNLAGIVNELRRVLEDDARQSKYIRTVHGIGYAFHGEVGSSSSPARVEAAFLRCGSEQYPLYEGRNTIGRELGCRITLNDRTVSRRHAVITIAGDKIWLEDLHSKNGTFVDGQLIRTTIVTRHNQIEFGGVKASISSGEVSTSSLRLGPSEVRRLVAEHMAG